MKKSLGPISSTLFLLFILVLPASASAGLVLLAPNGNEQWQPEMNYEITWRADPATAEIGLVLYKNKQVLGVIGKGIPASETKVIWAPGFALPEGNDYRIGIYEYPFKQGKPVDYSDSPFTVKKGVGTKLTQDYFSLGTKAQSAPLHEIFRFNPSKNSGWVYIAQTKPEAGKSFWAAAVRSFSNQPTDDSAQLLYGITDTNTNQHFSGFISSGSMTESADKINVAFVKDGKSILELHYLENQNRYELKANLPAWYDSEFHVSRNLAASRPVLLESGDGSIPMAPGLDSLYASLVFDGFWVDFQKYNGDKAFFRPANHRWMSFILDTSLGPLPAGTVGVGWEILDANNQRQPGGYTNIDLLIPGRPQLTSKEEEINQVKITELEYWQGNKKYLRKWKISYPGIELLFETILPDQEHAVLNNYFYEGMVVVRNPKTGEQVGTGMLEETHDESQDR